MTLYLTDRTDARGGRRAPRRAASSTASSSIPAGATTHSDAGVTDIRAHRRGAGAHGGARHGAAGARRGDRSRRSTSSIARRASSTRCWRRSSSAIRSLRIVFEHITTQRGGCSSCAARAPGSRATVTPQHLLMNRNALFDGRHPPASLLPAGAQDRAAPRARCWRRSPSGNPRFFLGTDSAPHARHTKEAACGCAGIFSAHAGIELYAEAFEAAGALDKLEGFAACTRRGLLRPAAQRGNDHPRPGAVGGARAPIRSATRRAGAAARRRALAWRLALRPRDEPASAAVDGAGAGSGRRRAHGAALPRLPAGGRSMSRPAASMRPPMRCWRSPRS